MKKSNTYLFIYLFCFLFVLIDSFTIVDLTVPGKNKVYGIEVCPYSYDIHIIRENGDEPISEVTSNTSSNWEAFKENDDNQIGILTGEVPIGQSVIQLTISGKPVEGHYLNLDCKLLPGELINSNTNFMEWKNSGALYYTFLKLNLESFSNLDSKGVMFFSPNTCRGKQIGFDILVVSCYLGVIEGSFNFVSVTFPDERGTINIPTFVKNISVEQTINYTIYPKSQLEPQQYKGWYILSNLQNLEGLYYNLQFDLSNSFARSLVLGNENDKTILVYQVYFEYTDIKDVLSTYVSNNQIINENIGQVDPSRGLFSGRVSIVNVIDTITTTIPGLYEIPSTIRNYYSFPYTTYVGGIKREQIYSYPNGLLSIVPSTGIIKSAFILPILDYSIYASLKIGDHTWFEQNIAGDVDYQSPDLSNVEFIPLKGNTMLVRAYASDALSGIYSIQIFQQEYSYGVSPGLELKTKDLVSGTIFNGTYEKYFDYTDFLHDGTSKFVYYITDNAGLSQQYSDPPVNTDSFTLFPSKFPSVEAPSNYQQQITAVTFVSFTINQVDLSEIDCKNRIYINFTNANIFSTALIIFEIDNNLMVEAKWDKEYMMFVGDFTIQPRAFSGVVRYSVLYHNMVYDSSVFPDSGQLTVHSDYADRLPPLILEVTRSPGPIYNSINGGFIEWLLTIEDAVNGLQRGIVHIVSNLNPYVPIIKELTVIPEDSKNSTYQVRIDIPTNCQTQIYSISYIELVDNSNVKSIYNNLTEMSQPDTLFFSIDPFFKMEYGIEVVKSISVNCSQPPPVDVTPPYIKLIGYSRNSIDTGLDNDRTVLVTVVLGDASRVQTTTLPTCYFYGLYGETISVLSEYQGEILEDEYTFTCSFTFPYGFSSLNEMLYFGIYGYMDEYYNTGGATPTNLHSYGFEEYIKIQFYTKTPIIDNILPYQSNRDEDGELTILGHSFNEDKTLINIVVTYENGSTISYNAIFSNNLIIVFKPDLNQIISSLYVVVDGLESGLFIKTIETIIPKPPVCPGTPICGGPSNGICTTFGCKCYDSWNGNDCQSKVIIITPPLINNTSPDINNEIPLPNGEVATLKSLISIVSLKELKVDGSVLNTQTFNQWSFRNLTLPTSVDYQEFLYTTDFTHSGKVTTVKVNIQYFVNQQTIYFANEVIDMKPSTLKYKISISKYAFESELNTLQLLLSSSLESTTADKSCSNSENGDVVQGGAEYMKLQINSESLYGRFVRRAVIDNRVQSVSNTFFNSTSDETGKLVSNLIGINIPHYKVSVLLDPDFSLLVDSRPIDTTSPTSRCSDSISKSGLSKTQLIGIIIGSIAFALAVGVSVAYYIYKKKEYIKSMHALQNKLDVLKQ